MSDVNSYFFWHGLGPWGQAKSQDEITEGKFNLELSTWGLLNEFK